MPKPSLTVSEILRWADAFRARRGRYPRQDDGAVPEADLTWSAVSQSLKRGYRGLPGGSSLAELLRVKRGVRNPKNLPKLTTPQILAWADRHHATTGRWPSHEVGRILGSQGETWLAVETALRVGGRGLPGGSSLAQLLEAERGARNHLALPRLTVETILEWADRFRATTGNWPAASSGPVEGESGESWRAVDAALLMGHRGLSPGGSLAQLLAAHRRVRHPHDVPRLSVEHILARADAHRARTGRWPLATSGAIADAPEDTWAAVDTALTAGLRGLPGGDSLARFLARHRGKRNPADLPPLTVEQIEGWVLEYHRRCGRWPQRHQGTVPDAPPNETWNSVNKALVRGRRGLPGGSSLARLVGRLKGQMKG